ncbi:radical SAM family heme chaperone HemW [Tabrizicola sp.]|jgi:oxygen-independent coproporphyrinogen-3 oxidase|uniref:radical SAM family heme chaperone HemW n=1 Tax=Tabrizicola sp. TaxID=2005166 RepID=UPI0025E17C3C|nr:radical SAM family heme chaperone HemW [Tabrizicola sp.]MBY0350701.1 radical SAM family heme chaperone HemW [Tabrizicola sp.]MDK2775864.1 radical SAM family heme chaperone HemW [Tabrizicola sp.]
MEAPIYEDWRHAGFGLYIHWPFCQSKCPYCDFNSHVAARIDQTRWLTAFTAEIDRIGTLTEGRILNSVFFGGGTPSLMEAATVQGILDRIRATWTLANDIEITLEANPGSVEAARFAGYANAGVNRVSLGIQSLDAEDLRRLGRKHTVEEAANAIAISQSTFQRVSIDLIYARQDQTLAAWREELLRALDFGTSHLSLYQLTIESDTVFGQMQARNLLRGLPGEDLAADMFDLTRELTRNAGLPAYEVSNHARPGDESRHNLIYWRMGDYAGIGPGAHGRLTLDSARVATEAERQPTPWLDRTLRRPGGAERVDRLSAEERATEYLMFALRLTEGASLGRFADLAGTPLDENALNEMVSLGFLQRDRDTVRTTETGVLVLNGVLRALLVDRRSTV